MVPQPQSLAENVSRRRTPERDLFKPLFEEGDDHGWTSAHLAQVVTML
jgi:hypothetical protein